MSGGSAQRSDDLREGLRRVRARVDAACESARRDPGQLCLIAVTKFFPASDAAALVGLGVTDIGESRDQEAAAKVGDLAGQLEPDAMPTVHMVGQVQTKKARSVVRWADVVHSVDRSKLVNALDRATGQALEAGERHRGLDVLVQVDLDAGRAQGRGGVAPQDALPLADSICDSDHLRLRGTMAVAPAGAAGDDAALEEAFAHLRRIHESIRTEHPQARWLSAGMSGDLEHAVAAGATHLRVGSGILGSRPSQG
ncbi:MAG: YggS family pyridoxal phosphate-dependent enzyme [Ornithinimicrobium sp.]